jgi:hypothetical protein
MRTVIKLHMHMLMHMALQMHDVKHVRQYI